MAYPDARHFPLFLPSLLLAGVLLTLLAGCGSDDDDAPSERQATVSFAAQVNSQDFVCGKAYNNVGVGQPGAYQVTDWRFYVHDVALVKADGSRQALDLDQDGTWQYENVALLNLRKDCGSGTLPTNTVVKGAVPNENYTGLCFKRTDREFFADRAGKAGPHRVSAQPDGLELHLRFTLCRSVWQLPPTRSLQLNFSGEVDYELSFPLALPADG